MYKNKMLENRVSDCNIYVAILTAIKNVSSKKKMSATKKKSE